MMSGRWLRIAPELSSTPLQTMSYCQARMSSGSLFSSASSSPCGIEKGLCEKSIFFWSSLNSNIGKSTIQQKRNASFSIRSSCSPTRVRAAPASLAASRFLAGGEENAVVGAKAELASASAVHVLGPVVLGDRPAPFAGLAGRIAEAGEALAARPLVHVVEEFAALLRGTWRRDRAHDPAPSTILANRPKPEPEVLADVGDQQRVAKVGLVGAVFEQRFLVGDAREFARRQ